jgi:hypothetical protein
MFESLVALFAIGTWGFFAVLTAIVILLVVYTEDDGVKATVTLVLGALFLQFIAKFDIASIAKAHPLALLYYALLYVALGLVWSVIKWHSYVGARRRIYDDLRKKFCANNSISEDFTPQQKKLWLNELNYKFGSTAVIPNVDDNKKAIIRWMTYWPFSLLFTLLNDPVRRFFEWIFRNIKAWFQRMANGAFRGTERDFFGQ